MRAEEFPKADFSVFEFHNDMDRRIKIEPKYFKLGFSSSPLMVGRKLVYDRLISALAYLPTSYGFLIWDIYRPRAVQKSLFNWMSEEIRKKLPHFSEEENLLETKKFIAEPSKIGEDYCPPHLSGGVIDLTLYDINSGDELDMGTIFDDCSARANRDYFLDKSDLSAEERSIQSRRRLLREAMESVGFTSYQHEWWHFDIGNLLCSQTLKRPALFGPLFGDEEWPELSPS